MNRHLKPLGAALAVIALGACATGNKPTAELEAARSAVSSARADVSVTRDAPLELERAEKALRDAETQWADRGDEPRTAHLAYLARQRALIAQEVASQRAAEQAVQSASTERDKVMLDKRTRETAAAQARAQQAQSEAQLAERRAAEARERNAQLQAQLKELSTRETPRGLVVTLGDVLFETGEAQLRPQAARELDRLAVFLRDQPDRRVDIEGHTDSVGSDSTNQRLSEERARAVRDSLVDRGIDGQRVQARGFGESTPVASNGSASGRALNRRVEVVISGPGGDSASRSNSRVAN